MGYLRFLKTLMPSLSETNSKPAAKNSQSSSIVLDVLIMKPLLKFLKIKSLKRITYFYSKLIFGSGLIEI